MDHPEAAADILIAANADVLTDCALIVASLKALVEGHYLRTTEGVLGTFDPAKISAIGDFMFEAGMLRDTNGTTLASAPHISTYYTNIHLL